MLIYVFSVFDDFLIKEIKYTSERHKMIKMKWTKAVRSWQDCNIQKIIQYLNPVY